MKIYINRERTRAFATTGWSTRTTIQGTEWTWIDSLDHNEQIKVIAAKHPHTSGLSVYETRDFDNHWTLFWDSTGFEKTKSGPVKIDSLYEDFPK